MQTKLLTGCVLPLLLCGALAQPQNTAFDCAQHYWSAGREAESVARLAPDPERHRYRALADSMSAAPELFLDDPEVAARMCSVAQTARLDALVAKLEPIRAALQAEQVKRKEREVDAAIEDALSGRTH